MPTLPYCLPANISPETFLAEYWQKKPLLIKNGLPQLIGMFEPSDIIELAQDEDATSRLITQKEGKWSLKNSPFTPKDFNKLPPHWTVLVQNMEQWSPDLANLWHAFDFIPQWQRDDIMVSYAPKGGSVGRHYDNYDVFLAQGYGARRWQLGRYCDENTTFEAGQPIRIMSEADMGELIFNEVLEAGDVLYVPTGLSHFGEAVDDCLTFSFGCRRLSLLQILDNLADVATHDEPLAIPLKIAQPLTTAGVVSNVSLDDVKRQLIELLQSPQGDTLFRQAVMETVSKRQYDLLLPEYIMSEDDIEQALNDGAVICQDLASRIVYDDKNVYVNGEKIAVADLPSPLEKVLKAISNGEQFDKIALSQAGVTIADIADWLENGWVMVDFV